jgi:hypothetical protein
MINISELDSKNSKRKLISETEYIQRNTKRLKEKSQLIESKIAQEEEHEKKCQIRQQYENSLTINKWYSLRNRMELKLLLSMADIDAKNQDSRKAMLLHSLTDSLNWIELTKLKDNFLTNAPPKGKLTAQNKIKGKYVKDQLFKLFRKFLKAGDVFEVSNFKYTCLEWKDDFSISAERESNSYTGITHASFVYHPNSQKWTSSDGCFKVWILKMHYDKALRTKVANSSKNLSVLIKTLHFSSYTTTLHNKYCITFTLYHYVIRQVEDPNTPYNERRSLLLLFDKYRIMMLRAPLMSRSMA